MRGGVGGVGPWTGAVRLLVEPVTVSSYPQPSKHGFYFVKIVKNRSSATKTTMGVESTAGGQVETVSGGEAKHDWNGSFRLVTVRKPGDSKSSTRSEGVEKIFERVTHEVFERISTTKEVFKYFVRILEHESGMIESVAREGWLSISSVISEATPPGPKVREVMMMLPHIISFRVVKVLWPWEIEVVVTIGPLLRSSSSSSRVQTFLAFPVISSSLGVIHEDLVSLRYLLELPCSFLLGVRVLIRMPFPSQLLVCLLDIIFCSSVSKTKNRVIVNHVCVL